jgi:hypothetical protein
MRTWFTSALASFVALAAPSLGCGGDGPRAFRDGAVPLAGDGGWAAPDVRDALADRDTDVAIASHDGPALEGGRPDAAACIGDLASVSRIFGACPASHSLDPADAAVTSFPIPCKLFETQLVGRCGGEIALVVNWGTHVKTCRYDAAGRLVAAAADDDVPTFCGFTSASIVSRVGAMSECTWIAERACAGASPDGGADAGS